MLVLNQSLPKWLENFHI